jgi:hypothetical protein
MRTPPLARCRASGRTDPSNLKNERFRDGAQRQRGAASACPAFYFRPVFIWSSTDNRNRKIPDNSRGSA